MFTARYALSPYIKQIRFFFKGLNPHMKPSNLTSCLYRLNNSNADFANYKSGKTSSANMHRPDPQHSILSAVVVSKLSYMLGLKSSNLSSLIFGIPNTFA
jgi:hypothetical protein